MALAFVAGDFAARERAEIGLFAALRPWLLILLVLTAIWWPWRARWALYGVTLLLATVCEALFVRMLGAPWPVADSVRLLLAGIATVALLDLVMRGVARWRPGGRVIVPGTVAGIMLLAIPGPLHLYASWIFPADPPAARHRPTVQLLTGLPLIWGEDGIAGALSHERSPAIVPELGRRFTIVPIDSPAPATLARSRLLLIAQPRPPGPAGLVAIDAWIRAGGRAMILTDPALLWPSRHPLGDGRRPPAFDGLGPLLRHWGLTLLPGAAGIATRYVDGGERRYRLDLAAPGLFLGEGGLCQIADDGLIADCRLGRGRALLIADADLIADAMWRGPGPLGGTRAGRIADNASFLIDRLDMLAGRPGAGDGIQWNERPERIIPALITALMLPALLMMAAVILGRTRREGRRANG